MSEHKKNFPQGKKPGFTLVELLLVIGIIAVLAGVVFVALDPAKRFQDARDARRLTDIENILSAVHQYVIDNQGSLPTGLDSVNTAFQLGTASNGCQIGGSCAVLQDSCLDLSDDLNRYLKIFPSDPAGGSSEWTHYAIELDSNNLVTVTACDAEALDNPSVSR